MKLTMKLCVLAMLATALPLLTSTTKTYALSVTFNECIEGCESQYEGNIDECVNEIPFENYGYCLSQAAATRTSCLAGCPKN